MATRIAIWCGATVFLLAVVVYLREHPPGELIGDGLVTVTVTVQTPAGLPVAAVYAEVFGNEPFWLQDLNHLPTRYYDGVIRLALQRPFTGRTLLVSTFVSEHVTYWGLVHRHYSPRKLLVLVEYGDGKKVTQLVGLPDLFEVGDTSVTVSVGPPSP